MKRTRLLLIAALVVIAAPARAGDLGEDGILSYWFHQYGSDDVTRPPLSPDRPYWHGDDAVPPAMRWHDRQIEDVDEYGVTIGPRLPPPAVAVVAAEAVVMPAPPPHLAKRHRVKHVVARTAVDGGVTGGGVDAIVAGIAFEHVVVAAEAVVIPAPAPQPHLAKHHRAKHVFARKNVCLPNSL